MGHCRVNTGILGKYKEKEQAGESASMGIIFIPVDEMEVKMGHDSHQAAGLLNRP
jgi:hypothetical protein